MMLVEAPLSSGVLHHVSPAAKSVGLVSVIIPNCDGAHFLGPCLRSLFEQGFAEDELDVLVIDNGSRDGSVELVRREFPSVRLMANETNVGFTRAINQGLGQVRGEWILLLNNDTVMQPGALRALLTHLDQSSPSVGGVQPLLLWSGDPTIVDSAGIILRERFEAQDYLHRKPRSLASPVATEVWGLCFACALLRRDVVTRTGALDPDFFAEWDDVDFATRARWLGFTFEMLPTAEVLHHRSPTSERDSVAKFIRLRRNRVLTYLKCLPRGMAVNLVLYRLQYDFGMLVHYAKRGELKAVLKIWSGAIRLAPRMIARHRRLRKSAQLSGRQMRRLIANATRHG